MVGCAPQIHHNATCQGRDNLCNEELPILMTTLRYMKLKSPPAGVLLDIIERLSEVGPNSSIQSTNDSSLPQETPNTGEAWPPRLPHAGLLSSLFSFPSSLSPRLSMIQGTNDELNELAILDRMIEQEDDDLEWIFNEYQLNYFDASFV